MKKGFTLIELITVVIIIAIMAALALPQYTRFIERSQASTAKNALTMIRKAQATYFALNSQYSSKLKDASATDDLAEETPEIAKLPTSGTTYEWLYSMPTTTATTFTATADRNKGAYGTYNLYIDQDGTIWKDLGGPSLWD